MLTYNQAKVLIKDIVRGKLENIIKVIGLTWEDVAGGSLFRSWG